MTLAWLRVQAVVKLAENFNGADLRNVCTEAGMFAIRDERDYVVHEVRHVRSSKLTGLLQCKSLVHRTQQVSETINNAQHAFFWHLLAGEHDRREWLSIDSAGLHIGDLLFKRKCRARRRTL